MPPPDHFLNKNRELSPPSSVMRPGREAEEKASPVLSKKRNVLGRGLQSLFAASSGGGEEKNFLPSYRTFVLGIEQIKPGPHQPRKIFDKESLNELADSIRKNGLIQPVVVKKSGAKYEIVAGERRWRACAQAGCHEIPVHLLGDKRDPAALALAENIHREDLNPMEVAGAFDQIMKARQWTQAQLSQVVALPRASVANYLRLLTLNPQVQELVMNNKLSFALAKLLLKEKNPQAQLKWARLFVSKKTSVQTATRLLSHHHKSLLQKPSSPLSFDKNHMLAKIQDRYNTSVKLRLRKKGGEISLCFYSEEHLKNLIKNLLHS